MFPFRKVFVLFWAHHCAGQIFSPFSPFPPAPPPPFIMFYTFPPVTLQAKLGGGLRASIPDDCGIESFEFESRKNSTSEWNGGNVTSKTEGNWIFEDPQILLSPGEALYYRCRIKQRGSYISNPDAEWVVPDNLVEEFDPPKPPKKPEECAEDTTTPKPKDKKKKTTPKPNDDKEETTPKPDEEGSTENPEDESTDEPEKEKKKPQKKKTPEKMKPEDPEDEEQKSQDCPAPGPKPGETREESLERKLWKVQCDMLQLAERSFKINEALSFELTELKKLNYVVVTRIQRLESLLRNLNRPIPFPSSPYY